MMDVASLANVSPSTVSLYLRKSEAVSGKLRDKVQQAIDALHYVPNRIAGSLAAAKSNTIAVIIPSISNSFFARTVEAMQSISEKAGYSLLLGNSGFNIQREEELVRTFLQWSPAGVILTGCDHTDNTIGMLEAADIPVGQMWDLGEPSFGLQVGFDNQSVGRIALQHLHQGGCKRVIYMGSRLNIDRRARYRADGYANEVMRLGLHTPCILDLPNNDQVVAEAGKAIATALAKDPLIDGVICSNDSLALGVLLEAQRRNIKVPERLSVIGFGDLDFAECTIPPLSTIRPHRNTIGRELMQAIIQRCEAPINTEWPDLTMDVGFELIPRSTTRII
ncbi:LacI family DNA-binding transcriptional regulator [Craterilacuibacter sp.]|uniref:LacI family DNA-binding transcriptional regulator n=1 Tax=Craterilacuibacter sp. TaxID=2870909 RepID=UPI003F2F6CBD